MDEVGGYGPHHTTSKEHAAATPSSLLHSTGWPQFWKSLGIFHFSIQYEFKHFFPIYISVSRLKNPFQLWLRKSLKNRKKSWKNPGKVLEFDYVFKVSTLSLSIPREGLGIKIYISKGIFNKYLHVAITLLCSKNKLA